MVVIAVDVQLPVVRALGEGGRSHDHAVVVAVAAHRLVVVGQHDVPVR